MVTKVLRDRHRLLRENIIGKDKAQHLIFFEKLDGYSTSKIIQECQKF